MSELKKCPFCGGEADIESDISDYGEMRFYVYCKKCIAEGGWGFSEKEAIELWNKRYV